MLAWLSRQTFFNLFQFLKQDCFHSSASSLCFILSDHTTYVMPKAAQASDHLDGKQICSCNPHTENLKFWNHSICWQICVRHFFISGHVSGGHVTVTDGDCRIYYTILNMSLHNSFISCGKSDPSVAYLHELFRSPACVHVMQWPSSEE